MNTRIKLLGLIGLQGVLLLILNFMLPFGTHSGDYTVIKILPYGFFFLGILFCTWAVFGSGTRLKYWFNRLFPIDKNNRVFLVAAFFAGIFLVILVLFVIMSVPSIVNRLGQISKTFKQVQWFIAWLGLSSLDIFLFLLLKKKEIIRQNWAIGKWYFLGVISSIFAVGVPGFYISALLFKVSFLRVINAFYTLIFLFFVGLIILWCWLGIKYSQTPKWANIRPYPRLVFIFLLSFLFYKLTAIAVGNIDSPHKAYFNDLAAAFLTGKLYLENPSTIHDLTFYNGNWYLPFPPLPAILMIPFVKIYGDLGFSTVTFTVVTAAINVALVFELLRMMIVKELITLKSRYLPWFLVLFGIGTIHWYMSVVGKVWFIERLLALTFMLLATVLALKRASPWWIGLAVALSLWARPNSIFLWPMLLGIYWQGLNMNGKDSFSAIVKWTLANAVPITISVFLLLVYNWLRFDNWFDFGYGNQNVGVNYENVQTYGFFNIIFVPRNLYRMWLGLPLFREVCKFKFIPDPMGLSILLTTPAFVYLFKSFKRSIWVVGAWLAFIFEMVLLSMQNGTYWEFGFGYIMDLIIPLLMLVALAAGSRISWLMRILILAGVAVNLWGVAWYFGFYCPMF